MQNLDGEFSFLNEVQRRADFHKLKSDPATANDFRCIVETVYADYRLGIILSEWIEGTPFDPTPKLLHDLFSTLIACEQAGLFEWDLCSGNLLVDDNNQLKLFDFGYMYPFEPRREFNSMVLMRLYFSSVNALRHGFFQVGHWITLGMTKTE